jgi:hypothetical protein
VQGNYSVGVFFERDQKDALPSERSLCALQELIIMNAMPLEPRLTKILCAPLTEILSNNDKVVGRVSNKLGYARFLKTLGLDE